LEYNNPSNPASDKQLTAIYGFPVNYVTTTAFTHEKIVDFYAGGITYDATEALVLTAAYYEADQNDYTGNGCKTPSSACKGFTEWYSLLADYKLSKRFDVYLGGMNSWVSSTAKGPGIGYDHPSNSTVTTGMRFRF
jgi:predicted porin